MTLIVNDASLRDRLIADRQATGRDRYDEVWNGDYVMSPLAGNEHQFLVSRLCTILDLVVGLPGLGEDSARSRL